MATRGAVIEAAIHQRRVIVYADQPAPGSRPDERPDFVLLEHPRKSIAARAGHFVDDHRFRTIDLRQWGAKFALLRE